MQMIVAPPMLQQAGCMDALQCQHFLLLAFATYGVIKGGVLQRLQLLPLRMRPVTQALLVHETGAAAVHGAAITKHACAGSRRLQVQHGGWMRCGFSGGCGTMCLGLVGVPPSRDDIILSGWCFKALAAGTRGWLMQPHRPLVTHSLPRSLHWVLPVAA